LSEGYRLAYNQRFIFAKGSRKTLGNLIRLPGAQWVGDVIAFPAIRASFLAAEMISSPASVTDEYRNARKGVMQAEELILEDIKVTLREQGFIRELLPFQLEAAYVARNKRGFYNSFEMGLGKTCWALAMSSLWASKRVLIVAPKSVCRVWGREWEVCFSYPRPFAFCLLDEGSVADRREKLVNVGINSSAWPVICALNYEVLHDLADAVATFRPDLIVFDESQRIKSEKALVTKAAIRAADLADKVLLLSGTPIGNEGVGDLYSQLRTLGQDVMPEAYWNFVSRYAELQSVNVGARSIWKIVGLQDPIGLAQRLDPIWYRATKELCLDLPPKVYEVVKLQLPPDVMHLYRSVEKDGEAILGNPLSLSSQRVVDIRLHQIAGGFRPEYSPFVEEEDVAEDINASRYTMLPLPSVKLEWLKTFAQDTLKDNSTSRSLIFCRYNAEGRRILEELGSILGEGKTVFICGETSNELIEEYKDSFNSRNPEGIQVLVCQIQKMALGQNLQAADFVVFYSNSWSYINRVQAEDRAHRIGREGAVTIIDLICEKTIDVEIQAALEKHQDYSERICRDTVGVT
jgi:SNF2 family DNA or RNA helicase